MNQRAAPWHVSNLELIVAQLQHFLPRGGTPQENRTLALLEKFEKAPADLSISEIFELDSALHRLLPTQTLLDELPLLRLRYREAIGERQYAAYTPLDPGSSFEVDDPKLRANVLADTQILLAGLYREYALFPHREGVRRSFAQGVIHALLIYTGWWVVLVSGLIYVNRHWFNNEYFSLIVVVTVGYFGIIGGYVSFLRRTQSVPVDTDSLLAIEEQSSVRDLLWSSPLFGAVFSIVLLLLFKGDLVSGRVFPEFADGLVPKGADNYAKLYFWSFVAGFAERFVPGVIDTVVQKSSRSQPEPASSPKQAE